MLFKHILQLLSIGNLIRIQIVIRIYINLNYFILIYFLFITFVFI